MFKSYFTTLILATTVAVAQAAMPATAGSDGTGAIDYLFEDFEGGTPAGWDLSTFYMAGGGVDGSLALINETYIGDSYILTPQVNLGDDPIIEFYYQVFGMRFMETDVTHPANPDYVNFYVEVSEDAGATWNTVYSIKPEGGDACHVTSSDFTQVSVPIRQYAGKTCQVRLSLPYFLDYTTLDYCRYIFDNISVGTRPSVDMAVYGLTGTAFPKNNVANEYSVTISNKGVNANSSYSVKIVDRDGNEIADIPAAKMESQEEKVFSFTWSPVKQGQTEIKAIVEVDGDNNLSDNETPWMHIDVIDDDTESLTVGTSSHKPKYSLPVNFYSRNNYIQMIYSANVLQMGMTIRGLRYDTDFALATQSCDFKVYIGETDKKDFSDGEWVDFSQLTEVFDGSVYVDIATQKMELAFSKPYQYMGKNLVVCVYRQDKDFYSNLLFHVDESAQFAAAAMGRESDSEVLSPENPGEGIVYDYMPVTTFVADVAATGSVGGKITNSQGNGIQGVDVSIKETGHTTTSDAEGNYSIEGLAPGIYSILCNSRLTVIMWQKQLLRLKLKRLP